MPLSEHVVNDYQTVKLHHVRVLRGEGERQDVVDGPHGHTSD